MWIKDGESMLYNMDLNKVVKIIPLQESDKSTLTLHYQDGTIETLVFKTPKDRDSAFARLEKHLKDTLLLL